MRLGRAAAIVWLALPAPLQAALTVTVGTVDIAPLVARGVEVEMPLPLGAAAAPVRLRARGLEVDGRLVASRLSLACSSPVVDGEGVRCRRGRVAATLAGLGPVAGSWSGGVGAGGGRLELTLDSGGGRPMRVAVEAANGAWRVRAGGQRLPLAAVGALAAALAGEGVAGVTVGAGVATLELDAAGRDGRLQRLDAALAIEGLDVEGASAAQGLDARMRLGLVRDGGWRVALDGAVSRGLAYVELPALRPGAPAPGLTIDASGAPVSLTLQARGEPGSGWELEALRLEQPSVLALEVQGTVSSDAGQWRAEALRAEATVDDLARAWPAWIQPWLLGTTLDALEVAGGLEASVDWRDGRLRAARLRPVRLGLRDRLGRFAVEGLDGTAAFSGGAERVRSALGWQGFSFYRLTFGAGRLALSSQAGRAWMTGWEGVPLFDGRLVVERLVATAHGDAPRLELDGTLRPVSLAALSQALGGPPLAGTVAASLAGLTLEPGRLTVDGGLEVAAFGGRIVVTGLRLDDPFGLVPVLHADVEVQRVDLEQLTAELDFGHISGHLDGHIRGLELQAWQPVYFEARFATPPDDDAPHRISQRAVTNLGRLGGGGTAVLSRGVLRLFSEYSYGQLGFSCRLFNGMLDIEGIAPAEGGSWLLTPGGLLPPWIGVRAMGHAVPWATLTDTLRAIRGSEVDVR